MGTFQINNFNQYKHFGKIIVLLICLIIGIFFCLKPDYSSQRREIEMVLDADKKAGDDIWCLLFTRKPNANEIISRMIEIDLSKCPPDFQKAYRKYLEAWKLAALLEKDIEKIEKQNNSTETALAAILVGFYTGYTGDTSILNEQIKSYNEIKEEMIRRAESVQVEISNTYSNVLSCASKYGVNTANYEKSDI